MMTRARALGKDSSAWSPWRRKWLADDDECLSAACMGYGACRTYRLEPAPLCSESVDSEGGALCERAQWACPPPSASCQEQTGEMGKQNILEHKNRIFKENLALRKNNNIMYRLAPWICNSPFCYAHFPLTWLLFLSVIFLCTFPRIASGCIKLWVLRERIKLSWHWSRSTLNEWLFLQISSMSWSGSVQDSWNYLANLQVFVQLFKYLFPKPNNFL